MVYRNNAENFNRLSRMHERYRRPTEGRQHNANMNVSSRSLKTSWSNFIRIMIIFYSPTSGRATKLNTQPEKKKQQKLN